MHIYGHLIMEKILTKSLKLINQVNQFNQIKLIKLN